MKYITNFLKKLFGLHQKERCTQSAFEMLLTWDPYMQMTQSEMRKVLRNTFSSVDGKTALKLLTQIVWIKKHELKQDLATLSWQEGREELLLWIFNILRTPENQLQNDRY